MVGELLEVSIRSIFYFLESLPNPCENENKKEEICFLQVFCFFVQFAGGVGIFFLFCILSFSTFCFISLVSQCSIITASASI